MIDSSQHKYNHMHCCAEGLTLQCLSLKTVALLVGCHGDGVAIYVMMLGLREVISELLHDSTSCTCVATFLPEILLWGM